MELALGSRDRRLGREGYRLEVGPGVRIEARTPAGAFYGTRTVLQRLNTGRAIQPGHARDWPSYPERGLMLDNGRRYFPPAWIKRQIRLMAYLKLNQLTCTSPTTRASASRATATPRSCRART